MFLSLVRPGQLITMGEAKVSIIWHGRSIYRVAPKHLKAAMSGHGEARQAARRSRCSRRLLDSSYFLVYRY
jgi:hypothetical protein